MENLHRSQGFVVLDGGLATLLEEMGHDLNSHLWSAKLLIENPNAIKQAHKAFLDAGSDVITSSTYQATVGGFQKLGLSLEQAQNLLVLSVRLAVEARDEWWEQNQGQQSRAKPCVAASMGCYGAHLADGSEYVGNYGVSIETIMGFHRSRISDILRQSAPEQLPDIWAFETIPCFDEAVAIIKVLEEEPFAKLQAWVSFSCRDGEFVCGGQPILDCAKLVCDCEQVRAVGVNCTAPAHLPSLLKIVSPIASQAGRLLIAYPNSGEDWDAGGKRWLGTAEDLTNESNLANLCVEWYKLGCTVIGGCCRMYPRHIQQIRNSLSQIARVHE
eukprot:c16334_g1_i3.p2 GENE.c16334_g1_i3~~c16334_g1_i3.p2  ORF type:complete len:329 (-),score=76.28 c16334_g1_i3:1225-2211(-)